MNYQINSHALRYGSYGNIHYCPFKSEKGREYGYKELGVKTVGKYLKNTVEGNQASTVFTISFVQVVPNKYHGSSTRQTYQDESNHIFGIIP